MADHHQSSTFPTTAALSPILHSIERMISREMEENADEAFVSPTYAPIQFTETELIAGTWTTRVTGIISLVSSIYMIWRAWNRLKEGVFHRLVFGMGIHLTIFGAANAIGSLAIPSETTNAWGNMGTTATCTAQGFLIYVTFMTACWYYVSFSVYAYVGTLSNFQNIVSMEKYIHILVHVYPVISGIYLITPGIFNNSGFGYCFLEVDPIGCGDHINKNGDIVPCKRGPDSHIQVQLLELFWDIPLYIEMIIPAGIMIALYYKVKTNQSVVQIPANEVVKQAILYLLALYAGIFPSAVVHTMEWGGSLSVAANKAVANLFADVMFMLFGLFTMLFYHYFTSGEWGESNEEDDESNHHDENLNPDLNNGAVEGQQDQAPAATTTAASRRTSKRRSIKSRYSFNIFDGTNSSGKFACFIFAGDSEDEREDNRETERWNEVQDHI